MSSRLPSRIGSMVLASLALCGGVSAQFVPPTPIPATTGPGTPSQLESIDPITGVLNLSFPVAKLPPGPGGFSAGVNLGFNSAIYQGSVSNGSGFVKIEYSSFSSTASVGSAGYDGAVSWGGWNYNYRYNLWSSAEPAGNYTGYSMYLTTPDGANHLLILTSVRDANGSPLPISLFQQNYSTGPVNQRVLTQPVYDVGLDGVCPTAMIPGYNTAICSGASTFTGQFTFATADSTFIRVESNASTGAWTAYMPDGTQATGSFIVFGNLLNSAIASVDGTITDRNGNQVTMTNYCEDFYSGICATVIKDRQEREITINYGATFPGLSWSDTITQPGVNGRLQTVVNWGPMPTATLPPSGYACQSNAAQPCNSLGQSPFVVTSVQFPSGSNNGPSTAYQFFVVPPAGNSRLYNWGELHTMTRLSVPPSVSVTSCTPASGSTSVLPCTQLYEVDYTYLFDSASPQRAMNTLVNPISSKTLTYQEVRDGASDSKKQIETTTYEIPVPANFNSSGPPQISGDSKITAPDGSVTKITLTNQCVAYGDPTTNLSGFCPLLPTLVKNPDGTQRAITWYPNGVSGAPGSAFTNPYARNTVVTVGNVSRGTSVTMDGNGNATYAYEYDWFNGSALPSTATRTTHTVFDATAPSYWDHAATVQNWTYLRAPQYSTLGLTETDYTLRTDYSFEAPKTAANLSARKWTDSSVTPNASLSQAFTYETNGNIHTATDITGVVTNVVYDSLTLYPVEVDMVPIAIAPNSSLPNVAAAITPKTTAIQVDFNSGLLLSGTDFNNSVTTTYAYDNIGRQTKVTQSGTQGGGSLTRTTSTGYDDVGLSMTTTADQLTSGDNQLSATTYYDPLGRVRLTTDVAGNRVQKAYRVGTGNGCAAPATDGGISTSATILSCELESNPYTAFDNNVGWTLTLRTANSATSIPSNGLVTVQKTTFGGAAPPAPWGNNTNVTGTAFVTANDSSSPTCWPTGNGVGPATDVTDQASRTTRYCQDGLGRLVGVTDALSNNTLHSYDLQDNLTRVTQTTQVSTTTNQVTTATPVTQTRTFSYSLSRILQACNPETSNGGSNCISYTYDDPKTGNLLTKTDAAGRTTCLGLLSGGACLSGYDGLNRPTMKSYGDSTPTVSYTYDQGGWSGALSLVAVTTGSGPFSTSYTYDALGRVASSTQIAAGPSYAFNYAYTLADQLIHVVYPPPPGQQTREQVDYVLDTAGRVSAVKNDASGGPTYAGLIEYTAAGRVATLALGNGVTEQSTWNDRLQLTQLNVAPPQLAGTGSPNNLLTLGLFPCTGLAASCSTGNVGNIQAQTITLPGLSTTQNYTYDALNHLTSVGEKVAGATVWSQTYNYISGSENRWVTGTPPPNFNSSMITPALVTDYNAANQLQNSAMGAPDTAGELTSVGPFTVQYDAEGRVKSSTWNTMGGSGNTLVPTQLTSYFYDGEGQRVMKLICPTSASCTPATPGAVQTVYLYDAEGNLAQELSTNPSKLPCTTCYMTVDQVGSTRLVTDGNGNPVARYDFLPFGEEIPADGANRTEGMGYAAGPDGFSPKFTGQMRDAESGFDYFNARYYDSRQGRFLSPDPGNAGANAADPTTWNGYAYAANNPLINVDPEGLGFWSNFFSAIVSFFENLFGGGNSGFGGYGGLGGLANCGGPLGNCGGLNDNPWSEQIPGSVTVQNPGGFVYSNGFTNATDPDNPTDSSPDDIVFAGAWGHHGLSEWSKINSTVIAYRFFRAWRTGPLADPTRNFFTIAHRAYNQAVKEVVSDFLEEVGLPNVSRLTLAQSRTLALRIVNSSKPAIRNFLADLGDTVGGQSATAVLRSLINRINPMLLVPIISPDYMKLQMYRLQFCPQTMTCTPNA
jgi:RHS repeat-associated protein